MGSRAIALRRPFIDDPEIEPPAMTGLLPDGIGKASAAQVVEVGRMRGGDIRIELVDIIERIDIHEQLSGTDRADPEPRNIFSGDPRFELAMLLFHEDPPVRKAELAERMQFGLKAPVENIHIGIAGVRIRSEERRV